MSRARARALPVAALVVAFTAAACSSSSGGSRIHASAPSNGTPDLAVAQQAVLHSNDLSDYKSNPHTAASDIPAPLRKKFAQCMGTPTTIFDTVPGSQSADSPDFSKGANNNQQVTSSVEIDPSRADVDAGWNQFAGKKTEPCLQQLSKDLIYGAYAKQLHLGPVHVTPFSVGVGDRSVGYAVSRSAEGPTQLIELDVDIIYVVRDRAGMQFQFFNYGPNPDRAAEKQIVQKVYDRIGNKAA